MIVQRHIDYEELQKRISTYQVTALLGPRQSGKTTLARQFQANHYFDLENPQDIAQFQHPQLTLERCQGLIIIDEIQRQPELFPLIRFLVDTHPKQHYLILGSASRDLIRQSSESLAGRISYYTLLGFRKRDVLLEQVESLWFCDSGIFHALLAIETPEALYRHPKLGNSWEGFALDCVWRSIGKPDEQAYFWATHSGAEVDLFWQHEGKFWACEFKFADAPTLTKSMYSALTTLNLAKLWVIYPGKTRYFLHEQIEVLPLNNIPDHWEYGEY